MKNTTHQINDITRITSSIKTNIKDIEGEYATIVLADFNDEMANTIDDIDKRRCANKWKRHYNKVICQ